MRSVPQTSDKWQRLSSLAYALASAWLIVQSFLLCLPQSYELLPAVLELKGLFIFIVVHLGLTLVLDWLCSALRRRQLLWASLTLFFAVTSLSYFLRTHSLLNSTSACALILTLFSAVQLVRPGPARIPNLREGHDRAQPRRESCSLIFLFIALAFYLYIACRYSFAKAGRIIHPAFDHGIFVQIFENIWWTLRPLSTLERGTLLSHSAVHFSPSLYLLAPFYQLFKMIFGSAGLNLMQFAIVLAALVPANLWLSRLGYDKTTRRLLLGAFALSPFLIFSSFYDFHENALLPLAIALYFLSHQRGRKVWIYLSTALLLGIKEDAFIYLVAISLAYFCLAWRQRDLRKLSFELSQIALALLYFVLATQYIKSFGLGIMSSRFQNLFADGDASLIRVLIGAYMRPGLMIMTVTKAPKILYLSVTFGISLGVLFWTRLRYLWCLTLPLFLVNLLSDWPYQYDFFFQYHYGTQILLCMALSIALLQPEISEIWRRRAAGAALVLALVTSLALLLSRPLWPLQTAEERQDARRIQAALAEIPAEATAYVSSFLASPLAERGVTVYEGNYYQFEQSHLPDYIVIDQRPSVGEPFALGQLSAHYEQWDYVDKFLIIYKKKGS